MAEKKREVNTKLFVIILSLLLVGVVVLVVVNTVLVVRANDENLAEKCLDIADEDGAMECLNNESLVYYEAGDCKKALEVYDDMSTDKFDKQWLRRLYGEARSMSLSCDESLQNYWSNKYNELINKIGAPS